MKKLLRNSIHTKGSSHDCLIGEFKEKKIKITYLAYNAAEKCNVEFFDGDKWNHIFSMLDMGVVAESSAYNIWNEDKRKRRADDLFITAEAMIKILLK